MQLGVLKETGNENRVAILPESIKDLKKLEVDVLVEKGAGEKAFIKDEDYEEAEAKVQSKKEVLNNADVLVKINPPTEEEAKNFPESVTLISLINPFSNKKLIQQLQKKKATSISLESIPRISRAQTMDVLSSQASIAGYKAAIIGAYHLPKYFPMMTTAAGSVAPAKVLVLGAGVAGLQAIATANRLGAVVEAFDVRSEVKEEVESLGGTFIEVEGAKEEEAGGYAVEQTEEYKKRQQEKVQERAKQSNVIITTAQIPGKEAPLLVPKDTVEAMNPGSVIIDLAASTGGNCELTKEDETVEHNGVTIIGNSNLPSTLARDASKLFGKNITNLLKVFMEEGEFQLDFEDEIIKESCIIHNGELKNEDIAEAHNLKSKAQS